MIPLRRGFRTAEHRVSIRGDSPDYGPEIWVAWRSTVTEDPTPTRIAVPDYVVFRPFVTETVVLNLETGLYHSLNPTAGRMLEVIAETGDLEASLRQLIVELDADEDVVRKDVAGLIEQLLERGLITVDDDPRRGSHPTP